MATDSTDRTFGWLVLLGLLVLLPVFAMGFGMMGSGWQHGMWGGTDGASGWPLVLGVGMQLLAFAIVVGGGYLAYRALSGDAESADPALEELRMAYARGDLSDEEFERRRERLEESP